MALSYTAITDERDIDILRGRTSQFQHFHYLYDDETLDFLKKNLRREGSLYLLAKDGENFAGFCSTDTEWWEDGWYFLREIFISPDFQKHGIGEELMRRCISHAKKEKAQGVVTETAFENLPMQKLCEKCGFAQWKNPQWTEGITYKIWFQSGGM